MHKYQQLIGLPALLLVALPARGAAQNPQDTTLHPSEGRWWIGPAAVGAAVGVFLLDGSVQRLVQRNKDEVWDGVAPAVRRFGEAPVYAGVPVVLLAGGLLLGDDALAGMGSHALETGAVAGVSVTLLKYVLARSRPSTGCAGGPSGREGDCGGAAFPSGHTAMAFALAGSLARDIRRPWATAILYTAAGATAWSRLYDDRHWLSDVAVGALLGEASARLARWRQPAGRGPQLLVMPAAAGGVAIGFHLSL